MILWELGQEAGRTRLMDRDRAYQNLCVAWDILKKNGIKCWLSHGTMLGIYRDGNFIWHDDDIDIGADIDTGDRATAEEELRGAGFFVPPLGDKDKPVDPESNMPYSDTVAIKDGEKIEIWWFQKLDGKYRYDIYRPPTCLNHDPKYYDTLAEYDFKGKIFEIPSHIEGWLAMMYGDDWKVPQRGRKYNESTDNWSNGAGR